MAARRLVIVMLVLLGVSTLAAVFMPTEPPGGDEERTATGPAPGSEPEPEPRGELVRERIVADEPGPVEIAASTGDQLALTVRSSEPDQVAIPDLGLLEPVARLSPARFDLLLSEEGTHRVRLLDADRLIGRIRVSPSGEGEAEGEAEDGERLPEAATGIRTSEP